MAKGVEHLPACHGRDSRAFLTSRVPRAPGTGSAGEPHTYCQTRDERPIRFSTRAAWKTPPFRCGVFFGLPARNQLLSFESILIP
jgi:hypothetical protein